MYKNKLLLSIGISFLLVTTGCSHIEKQVASDNTQINQIQQNGNEAISSDIKKIEINYDSQGVYWTGGQPVEISDKKIISDIDTMISKSTLITDQSKINNMSGMATKNNKLIFIGKDSKKKEITFAYDDAAFAVGYLDMDGKKYDPGYTFFRYIRDFSEYRKYSTDVDAKVLDLFKKYGWTVDYRINTVKETLPSNLKHEAGEYPLKIYWAYNKEFSKNIGLDYSSYLGKDVDVEIFRLREQLPEYMKPYMDARGIVLKYNGKIIGAYIDAGRQRDFACSLDRKNLKDITNKDWDKWVDDYINYDNDLEIKLSKMKPEDIIKQYFEAMNNHDEKIQYACMTRQNICDYITMNMDNNKLFNKSFDEAYIDGEKNINSVKFIKLSEMKEINNPKGTIEYAVTVDFNLKKEITTSNGIQTRFVLLRKESEKSGWRISGEGTGP